MKSVLKKCPLSKRDKTKAPPESKADFLKKECHYWKRKANLLHEIELQIMKVSMWDSGQNTDSIGEK